MVNLKENFGRRTAVICMTVAAALAIVVALAFSGIAKAAVDTLIQDTYVLNDAYLTTNVQAAHNADFNTTFKYTFTEADKGRIQDPGSTGDKGPAQPSSKPNLEIEGPSVNIVAENGNISSNDTSVVGTRAQEDSDKISFSSGTLKDNNKFLFKSPGGHGTTGLDDKSVTYQKDASVWAYCECVKMSSFLPEFSTSSQEDLHKWFQDGAGRYCWDVTVTQTNCDPYNPDWWNVSASTYIFSIYVEQNADDLTVVSSSYSQVQDDKGSTVDVPKKDPRWNPSTSNHNYGVKDIEHSPAEWEGIVYEGFTFASEYEQDNVPGSFDSLEISKLLDGKYASNAQEFTFSNFALYSNTLNDFFESGTNKYPIVGVVLDKDNKYVKKIDFTTTQGKSETGGVIYDPAKVVPTEGDFKLKGWQKLVFNGETYNDVTASKLPVGTYYELQENAIDAWWTPKVDVYTANFAGDSVKPNPETFNGSSDSDLAFAHKLIEKPTSTVAKQSNNATVAKVTPSTDRKNAVVFTNTYSFIPSGFMIDALPFVVMIGLPILAFAAWFISRKRKANNR